jgi:hypothetical protein
VNPFNSRTLKNAYLRIARHPGTPESIARGVSIGCFTAFFIPFTLQMPVALLLSIRLRAARIAAMLFTWISNPLTIPFLYPAQCYVGSRLIRIPLTSPDVKERIAAIVETPSPKLMASLGSELLASFLMGGILFGTIAAIIGYYSSLPWIKWHRNKRELRRQNRKQRAAARKKNLQHGCSAK